MEGGVEIFASLKAQVTCYTDYITVLGAGTQTAIHLKVKYWLRIRITWEDLKLLVIGPLFLELNHNSRITFLPQCPR